MSAAPRTVVLASRNEDKLRELRQICEHNAFCEGQRFEVTSILEYPGMPEVIEDGTSALGNATRKALAAAAYTGEIAVADDTTLQVFNLGDLPDVFASRFAGPGATYEQNSELVLELMADVPEGERGARFETSMVWIDPRPQAGLATAAAAPAASRWLHDPFQRSIRLAPGEDEDGFWDELVDRKRIWSDYYAWARNLPPGWGADRERLLGIIDRLMTPYLHGGRPEDAPADAIYVPDTRLWTAGGREDRSSPPTLVSPTGLPADAPGRAGNAPIWFELSTSGRLLGQLAREPFGTGGFGYDPIFLPDGSDRTLAEMSPEEKEAISHRGRALGRLMQAVRRVYGAG
jgi:inosine/xanthosine triphosphate pyrophosphatase family protein